MMIRLKNAMSGAELNEIQKIFDRVITQPWFVRDDGYESDLAACMIHMYLNGITKPRVLYEMGERAARLRGRASNVGSKAAA
jgi:hypothetical protein